MSTARSVFTEAIEEHLTLKRQNAGIESSMPLARYDVGDPLDRYPGGMNRALEGSTMVVSEELGALDGAGSDTLVVSAESTQLFTGPSPEQAMEAATALDPAFGNRPFEPLSSLAAPMLSLVEDIDDEDASATLLAHRGTQPAGVDADVLRFPSAPDADAVEDHGAAAVATHGFDLLGSEMMTPSNPAATALEPGAAHLGQEHPTGEQPVIVIDTDEPLAPDENWASTPAEPSRSRSRSRDKPRFFGLGRKKRGEQGEADGWFTDGPRDFNWD